METVDLVKLAQTDSLSLDEASSLLGVKPRRKEMQTGRAVEAGARPRSIQVVLPAGRARRWHTWLIDRLHGMDGIAVQVVASPATPVQVPGLELLLRIEQLIFGVAGERAGDRVEVATGEPKGPRRTHRYDLVVDLTEAGHGNTAAGRRLRPLFDGERTSAALVQALLDRKLPVLEVADDARDEPVMLGQAAVETPEVLSLALDNVLSRMAAALVAYVEAACRGDELDRYGVRAGSKSLTTPSARWTGGLTARAGSQTMRKLASAVANRLNALVRDGNRWSIAYRRQSCPTSIAEPGVLDPSTFAMLPDDGARYFADPFPIVHQGRTWVFCEEFLYATGKGIISAFSLDADGRTGRVQPVLEADCHLSYPQVFEADGAIWMIPESASRNHVALYRCLRFPDRWEQAAVLVEGDLHDATVFRCNGRWWMTAGSRDWNASSWDTLSLFHAERLLGPWRPSAVNPVLTDVRCARPAGAPFISGQQLVRPAQDCSGGYGSRLTLAAITHLEPDRFAQRVLGSVSFGSGSGLLGPHTLNCAGGWMLLDSYGRPSRRRI